MKRLGIVLFVLLALAATVPLLGRLAHFDVLTRDSPHKVYVILGFHTNFYHSWRGDTPDEAGFGTDIRIVREILRMLDEANEQGLDARGYWESDTQFTLESILPEYAPDIIEGIRRRVEAGQDEVLIAPYNNGFLSAMTEPEVRAALRWAVSNPWQSGAEDLFGSMVPIVRPQESMFTPGLVPILLDEGMEGVILPYSSYPFTAFTNFVPLLPPAQRFGLTWMRSRPDGPRILLFPSVSLGDVIDFVSLEKWMLELRELQLDGSVDQDLVIHINFDADAESWLPLDLPPGFGWLPNTGGLREYIEAVNQYDWAEFSTPGEFVAARAPQGEVLIDRDTADGAWDGYFSWSEKHGSQQVWTRVQQSRLFEGQALTVAESLPDNTPASLEEAYFSGRDGSFYQRLRSLSTTHFGMSNPMINDQRFAAATDAADRARGRALDALRAAARARAQSGRQVSDADVVYGFELHAEDAAAPGVPVRIPLVLPGPATGYSIVDADGAPIPSSLVDIEPLGGNLFATLVLPAIAATRAQPLSLRRSASVPPATAAAAPESAVLRNDRVQLAVSAANGVDSLLIDDERVGGADFLSAFITYRNADAPESFAAREWHLEQLEGERLDDLQRIRLHGRVPFGGADEQGAAHITVDFSLPGAEPFVVADVVVRYPYTEKRDVLATPQQKLRKRIDMRWIEVAPFQLHPRFDAAAGEFLKVWRENYLDVVGGFALDYARINPNNANIDSFNHHITGPWLAVAGGGKGLLIAQDATVWSSSAFAPMRLRTVHGRQDLWINPYGSYYGEQLDYSHMGGNGLGTEFAKLVAPALRSNGPSYNGETVRFSLLLAPYVGDEPPAELQRSARTFFAPPAVVYLQHPAGVSARVPADMHDVVERLRRAVAERSNEPVAVPRSLLASPADEAIDLVWDPVDDPRVDGYELQRRARGSTVWQTIEIGAVQRHRLDGLGNGSIHEVRVRARAGARRSAWSDAHEVIVGPVGEQSVLDFASHIDPRFVLRVVHQSLIHAATVP